ncbi:MAG: type II toxin-antitoxin system RelE/ParE family toxin [Bacteroidetes bacterium]|nr:type II toxin-antitoxin system RelE/ParE family toxin [Bacteroidota bacterium]MBU2585250.1 type II toxin-antitoxin system RelE/ParE family toxin [Bacteroidota bacterium]
MREIIFYRTVKNKIPVEEFFESLSDKQVEKILWVLRLIKQLERIPIEYFKKLEGTNDIWEVRASSGNNEFRLLGFWHQSNFIVLTNGFRKKSQKTPKSEIKVAESRKKDFLERKSNG